MKYNLYPLKGANDIEFGMSVFEVRGRMSGKFEVIDGGSIVSPDDFPVDYYREEGVLCFFDDEGHLEGMQFYEPSRPTLGIVDLLSISVAQAASLLRQSDPNLEFHVGDGFVSRRMNISIFAHEMEEDDSVVVGNVVVASSGYYDYLDKG